MNTCQINSYSIKLCLIIKALNDAEETNVVIGEFPPSWKDSGKSSHGSMLYRAVKASQKHGKKIISSYNFTKL